MDAADIAIRAAAILAGYLLGSIDFGVIVPRMFGIDIYGTGSGNPGASNVLRTVGRREAALVLLGDLAKGAAAAALGWWAGGEVIGWAAGLAAALSQGEPGAYGNFVGDEGAAKVREVYPGPTWDRLRAVKARYDPTNLFRLNANIPPAG